jgi:hypothetical protein
MTGSDPKAELRHYLQVGREALVWKLEGLSEYQVRRPMVPTGTNLLGLIKHVASVEAGYFGATFGRPFEEPLPWLDEGAEPNADMWATPEESVVAARAPGGDPAPHPGAHDRRDRPPRRPRRHRP